MKVQADTYGEEYLAYLRDRSAWRRRIRQIYLNDIRRYCMGPTVDFGCGVGELLTLLPPGSIGFEINHAAVNYCKQRGLDVRDYDPLADAYRLSALSPGRFRTFTMNHVLEHLDDPANVLSVLFESCARLMIQRVVLTVPGPKGYATDRTHMTFVDEAYLLQRGVFEHPLYGLLLQKHFPVNWRPFGRWFTHNEYRLVFERRHA